MRKNYYQKIKVYINKITVYCSKPRSTIFLQVCEFFRRLAAHTNLSMSVILCRLLWLSRYYPVVPRHRTTAVYLFAIQGNRVGMGGFEPPISCSQSKRLSH